MSEAEKGSVAAELSVAGRMMGCRWDQGGRGWEGSGSIPSEW